MFKKTEIVELPPAYAAAALRRWQIQLASMVDSVAWDDQPNAVGGLELVRLASLSRRFEVVIAALESRSRGWAAELGSLIIALEGARLMT